MSLKKVKELLSEIPIMGKISIILGSLVLVSLIVYARKIETFIQQKEFIMHKDKDDYDDNYGQVYDLFLYDKVKSDYEIGAIVDETEPNSKSVVLDIGLADCKRLTSLKDKECVLKGVTNCDAMLKKAKETCGLTSSELRRDTPLNTQAFSEDSLTHILCLDKQIYEFEDKRRFFHNAAKWLKPGGYLAIHLVNTKTHDPQLRDNSKVRLFDNTSNATSLLKRGNHEMRRQYEIFPNDVVAYRDIYTDHGSSKTHQYNHTEYLASQKDILRMAADMGFIMLAQIELDNVGYKGEYIYILNKAN